MTKEEKLMVGLMTFGLFINGATLGASVQRILEQIEKDKAERTVR